MGDGFRRMRGWAQTRDGCLRGGRQPGGQQLHPAGLGGLGRGAPQPGELLAEFRAGRRDAGGGFDLAAAQFQLQLGAPALGFVGHRGVAGGRFAGPRVNEEEFLLRAEGGKVAGLYQRAAIGSAASAVG